MKKILSIVLTLALALSLSVTAFAGATDETGGDTDNTTPNITIEPGDNGDPTPTSGETNVKYSVAPAYTVTIPPSVTIDGSAVTVSAAGVKIATGQKVVVTLTGINVTDDNADGDTDFTVALKDNTSETLEYTVTASGNVSSSDSTKTNSNVTDQEITKGGVVLTVEAGLNNETGEDGTSTGASKGSTELTFALNDTIIYAGEYSGTVTFTMSVESSDTTGTTP